MYQIQIESNAEKDLKKLPDSSFLTIVEKIKMLSKDPRPDNCRKIKDSENFWRIRSGNYRVIYEIIDSSKLIRIYKIKHRKDAYR